METAWTVYYHKTTIQYINRLYYTAIASKKFAWSLVFVLRLYSTSAQISLPSKLQSSRQRSIFQSNRGYSVDFPCDFPAIFIFMANFKSSSWINRSGARSLSFHEELSLFNNERALHYWSELTGQAFFFV